MTFRSLRPHGNHHRRAPRGAPALFAASAVDADHAHYKWWALSCTSLGMLLATINSGTLIIALPDLERALAHRPAQLVWVILAYMIASTVLVLTAGRLSDLFGRKQAYVAGFVLFSLASLGAGFAGERHRAHPLADRPGRRRRAPLRQRRARSSPTPSRRSSSASRWARTSWSPPSASCSARCWAARSSQHLLALGLLVQRPARARSARSGPRSVLHELGSRDGDRGFDSPGTLTYVVGLTGLVYGISRAGSPAGATRYVIGGLVARASSACRCSC